MPALRVSRGELNDIPFAQGVLWVGHKICRDLRICLANVTVPHGVAVGDADSTVHAANGDHSAGLQGIRVVAEGRRSH